MININFADDWIWTADLYIGSNHCTNWATTTASLIILHGVLFGEN